MGLGERCKLPRWGLVQSPSRQTIWCIFQSESATLVEAVFVDLPKNECNFLHKTGSDIVRRVQFLTGRRPMRSFSPGAVATIALLKSAPMPGSICRRSCEFVCRRRSRRSVSTRWVCCRGTSAAVARPPASSASRRRGRAGRPSARCSRQRRDTAGAPADIRRTALPPDGATPRPAPAASGPTCCRRAAAGGGPARSRRAGGAARRRRRRGGTRRSSRRRRRRRRTGAGSSATANGSDPAASVGTPTHRPRTSTQREETSRHSR